MTKYLAEVYRMEKFFDKFEVRYVPRLDNCGTNHLVWITSSKAPSPPDVIIKNLSKPSVKPAEAIKQYLMVIDEPDQESEYDWMHSIKLFPKNQPPSDDNTEVERITCKSKQYHIIDGILFQRGANGMIMKCICREEGI
jgi:hypothetical protein